MRFSRSHVPTLKEAPAEATVASHVFLIRGGSLRQEAAGIYSFLPLGWRVVHKIENIIREEMNRAGAQEILMPATIPGELWQESGRWEQYGPELLRFKDRKGADFVIGPTHEEVVVDLVRRDVRSYRQLPLNLYQIQLKFRDEMRPRGGTTKGAPITLATEPSEAWRAIQAPGIDKFERDRFGDQPAVAGLSKKFADGLAPDFSIIARKFIHVHPNKAVRPFQIETTCSSTGNGSYCGCLSNSTSREPRSSWAREAASRSDANAANASRSRYCDRLRRRLPATDLIALICALPPTRDTERPTLMAGRMPALNRSASR